MNQPVFISAGSVLAFKKPAYGARCYLSVYNELNIEKWLGSYTTNLKASAGGFMGRRLMKDDRIFLGTKTFPMMENILLNSHGKKKGLE